jgi:autoinducer 2-degrading protein
MSWALYAEFTAASGAEDRVAELVRDLTLRVRAEPGNVVFNAHTVAGEPRKWFVYEVYRDEDAFRTHLAADYGATFNAALAELVEGGGSRLTLLDGDV